MDANIGVGGIFALMILKEVFSFLKAKKEKEEASCDHDEEDSNYSSKLLVRGSDFKRLIESIDTNTRAIRDLLDHEQDERRILYRVEKQLDDLQKN